MAFFYDHIVLVHHIHQEIEALPIHQEDKQELIDLIEETVHHYILKRILDRLHVDHHEDFLSKFHDTPSNLTTLSFLKNHVPDIEFHIREAADEIKFELLKTIREL